MSNAIPRNSPYKSVQPLHKERSTMQPIPEHRLGSASAMPSSKVDGGTCAVTLTSWSTRGNYKTHVLISPQRARALATSLEMAASQAEAEQEKADIRERLEYLRGCIRAESISYGELAELQGLAEHIEPGDVELAEWAGIPEDEFAKRGLS